MEKAKQSKMPYGLQKYTISELLTKTGYDPGTLDINSEIDSSLTLEENIEQLEHRFGPLTRKSQKILIERSKFECDEHNKLVDVEEKKKYDRLAYELWVQVKLEF